MSSVDGWEGIVVLYAEMHRLSSRESRLLVEAIKGATDKGIAAEWGCSRATVATYWKRIFTKTGARPQRGVLSDVLRFAGAIRSPVSVPAFLAGSGALEEPTRERLSPCTASVVWVSCTLFRASTAIACEVSHGGL